MYYSSVPEKTISGSKVRQSIQVRGYVALTQWDVGGPFEVSAKLEIILPD
jgi:hypothetical protein